eukprot:COSAG01_NODE_2670_length_7274_cov_4.395540_4_plen_69_part_00
MQAVRPPASQPAAPSSRNRLGWGGLVPHVKSRGLKMEHRLLSTHSASSQVPTGVGRWGTVSKAAAPLN